MHAVHDAAVGRESPQVRQRHLHDVQHLRLFGSGCSDQTRATRAEEVGLSGVPRGLGRNTLDTNPIVRLVARLFQELAARGFLGSFVRLDHSCGKLEAGLRDAVAVLPNQNDFGSVRDTKHAGPIWAVNHVEAVDLVSVGETHAVLPDLEPTFTDEELALQNLPRFHGPLVTRVAVRWLAVSEDLRRALKDPGYTPPRRAFSEIFALLSHPELGEKAERALLSAGLPAATYAAEKLSGDVAAAEPAMVRLIGRAAREHDLPPLLEALSRALHSPHAETRRQAAIALGKTGRRAAEPLLLACLPTPDPKLLRSVVEALGKVGGEQALARLSELEVPANLRQVADRARLMLERSLGRTQGVSDPIVLDQALPAPLEVTLSCRAGLESYLAEEAKSLDAQVRGPGEVALAYSGFLRPLLELRLASSVAIAWPLVQGTSPGGVLNALLNPQLVRALEAWSSGPLRFRLEWQGAGHRRADTWRIAQGLRDAGSPLLNDPAQAPWSIEVQHDPERLLLRPAAAPELRFGYRVRDVPAASHPTIAAALARIAGVREADVVWDPFVGSGVELVERARLGPYRALHGTDLDARALGAAKENLESAGVPSAVLQQADARNHRVAGLSLVLTNPPMGRRVLRARGLSGVLCQVVRNVAAQLVPGGRMLWLSPFPDATARAAADAGLSVERLGPVDLGGFAAELQRYVRPS